jgi:hypothetical protein
MLAENRAVVTMLANVPWDRPEGLGVSSSSAAVAEITANENGRTGRLPGVETQTSSAGEITDSWRRVRRATEIGSRD